MDKKNIYVHQVKNGFKYVKVPLELLRDKKLSHQAFHLFCYLQSQAPHYNCMKWKMMEHFGKNKDTITNWLDELKDRGLVEIKYVSTGEYNGYATFCYAQPQIRIMNERKTEKGQSEKVVECELETSLLEVNNNFQEEGDKSPQYMGEKTTKSNPEKLLSDGGENSEKGLGDKTPPIINTNIYNEEISRNNVVPESKEDSVGRSNISTTNNDNLIYQSEEVGEIRLSESGMDSYRKIQEESDRELLELIRNENEKRKAKGQS